MDIQEIAAELKCTVEDVGQRVYRVAAWIDKQGNTGYSDTELTAALDEHLLYSRFESAWEGIAFYRQAKRKKERSGWQVRKNPHWAHVWADRYNAWQTEQGQQILDQMHEQAIKDYAAWKEAEERKRLNRPERFELGPYDDYSDDELIYLSEALGILEGRYSLKWVRQRPTGVNIWRMIRNMVGDAQSRIERELYCRHHTLPDIIEPDTPFSHSPRYDVFSHEYRQAAMWGEKEPELLRPEKEEAHGAEDL